MSASSSIAGSARRTIFAGFRQSATKLFGEESLAAIGRLTSPECRDATCGVVLSAQTWLPEQYVMEWYDAAWEGPCGGDQEAFRHFVDGMMDAGFGRVRRLLLGMASPSMLLTRAPELWRYDHSEPGRFEVELIDKHGARITLADHPYTTTARARFAVAEIYRYALSLTRISEVSMRYTGGEEELAVSLSWR